MIGVAALLAPQIPALLEAQDLAAANVSLGRHLQIDTQIKLSAPSPSEGLLITVKSNDPAKLLLSASPTAAGSESIQLRVESGRIASPDFFLQALSDSGTASYIASTPGRPASTGSVTLVPSSLVIAGNPITTVAGAPPARITVYAAQADDTGRFTIARPVRGGFTVPVRVISSDPKVGVAAATPLAIAGGDSRAITQFTAATAGVTTLTVEAALGFHESPGMKATVNMPGLSITDQERVGKNLEALGSLSLGAPAPAGGVTVTLTSSDPTKLLISKSQTEVGSKAVTVAIPAGGHSANYFLQVLGDSGGVAYTATAPGYRDRQATIEMTPSGVLMGAPAPPDEREVLRPEGPEPPHGFYVSLAAGTSTKIGIHTVSLDPKTLRGADITTQILRPGLSITVPIGNTNPAVGTLPPTLTIVGGTSETITDFKMLSVGTTTVSITNPAGFTTPSNAQFFKGIVAP